MRRLAGFILVPLLSFISPLLVLPLIARSTEAETWAALGAGQSVGTFLALVVGWGWTLVGPVRLAQSADECDREKLYLSSLHDRFLLLGVALVASALLMTQLVNSSNYILATAMSFAVAAGGLSPAFYAIGVGRPRLLLYYELVPRALALSLSAILIRTGADIIVYPLALLTTSLIAPLLVARKMPRLTQFSVGRALLSIRTDWAAASTSIAGGLYSTTVVAFAAINLSVSDVARISSADRTYKLALWAIIVVSNSLQSWVAASPHDPGRTRIAAAALLSVGALGGLFLVVALPTLTTVLYTSSFAASSEIALAYGLAFASVAASTLLGRLVLLPRGRLAAVAVSTFAGALVGIPTMLLGFLLGGPFAGVLGFAAGEVAVVFIQLGYLLLHRAAWRSSRKA